MKGIARVRQITTHLVKPNLRSFTDKAASMKLDMNTTLRMKSGYEIPVLGYGK
jgi:hypothetical protein